MLRALAVKIAVMLEAFVSVHCKLCVEMLVRSIAGMYCKNIQQLLNRIAVLKTLFSGLSCCRQLQQLTAHMYGKHFSSCITFWKELPLNMGSWQQSLSSVSCQCLRTREQSLP